MTKFGTYKGKIIARSAMIASACLLIGFSGAAQAQGVDLDTLIDTVEASQTSPARKSNSWSTQTFPSSSAIEVFDLDDFSDVDINSDNIAGINPVLKNALFDLPMDTTAPLFKLDLSGSLCLDTYSACLKNDQNNVEFDYSRDFAKGGYKDIDLALTPRAGMYSDDESSSALVGALVKIGDNLKSGSEVDSNTWYVFAGADAQALTYAPDGSRNLYNGRFQFQDRIIVGDAQAGVAYRLGDADFSLTYLRREARAENYKFEEDAAALSLTWRR